MNPDPLVCPRCTSPLSQQRCLSCGLHLVGPHAARLWAVDTELAGLPGRRQALLSEREHLLEALSRPSLAAEEPVPLPARDRTRSPQNTLLGLGALLLAVAATVFGTVTYDLLGASGRAVVLAVLTVLSLLAAPALLRLGMSATAEAAGAVALALGALDAYGLRTLGLGAGLGGTTYAAISAGVLMLLVIGGDVAVRDRVGVLRGPRPAALVLLQLTVFLSLAAGEVSGAPAAVVLAGLTAADALATRVVTVRVSLSLTGVMALLGLTVLAETTEPGLRGASVVLLWAGLAACGARWSRPGRTALTAFTVLLLAAGAVTLVQDQLTDAGLALVALAVAAVAAVVATRLPTAGRGTRKGSFLLIGLAAATVAEAALTALAAPFVTLNGPWRGAALLVGTYGDVSGMTVGVLLVLVAATLSVAGALVLAGQARWVWVAAPVGLVSALALAPFALTLPYVVVVVALTATTAALLAADRTALSVAGSAVGALALAWSLADRTATLAVVPVLLAVAVTLAVLRRRPVAAGVCALLLTATASAYAAAAGLAAEQTGALLVVVVAALVALASWVSSAVPQLRACREALAGSAAVTAVLAVGLALPDTGWLSWTLAGLGLVALAGALRHDRRPLAPVGALLLSGSSWVRLADAGVSAPEPYVLPVALLALVLGHLRRRQVPSTSSTAAYGPGLILLLVPSLLAALEDTVPTRGLLLAVGAVTVLLVGARARLRAPLAVGAVVLGADALHLLSPYVSALPRWTVLAVLGAILLGVGASYEQRRRDLTALRDRFDALA